MNFKYGLSNASLDAETEKLVREEHPKWDDNQVAKEVGDRKKKLGLYNKYNTKSKSTKKVK